MTMLKRGMIIDVNLDPTKGSETGKIRPCIVVTKPKIPEANRSVQVTARVEPIWQMVGKPKNHHVFH